MSEKEPEQKAVPDQPAAVASAATPEPAPAPVDAAVDFKAERYEPLKRYTKEDLRKYLEEQGREGAAAPADEAQEPLKRYTKEDLRRYLEERAKAEEATPPPAAATEGETDEKLTLAPLVESERDLKKIEQNFPRSFATQPCKPNCDPDPKARILAVALIIAAFVGTAIYLVVQREKERNKPHEIPKNMPMRILGGHRGTNN
jgi:predicted HicB family RNase H-like nuclease